MRNLVLVNPVVASRSGLNTSPSSRHPSLALASLAGLTPDDWNITVLDENIRPIDLNNLPEADLVGVTVFTAMAPRAYEIAAAYHKKRVPTVCGGVHPWARPTEASHHFDAVVIGEAESVWGQLVNDVQHRRMEGYYYGKPTDWFAKPRRDVLDPSYYIASVATSRGCPNNCAFCSVHEFSGQIVRRESFARVMEDMHDIPQQDMFVCDDNFPGHSTKHRQQALDILHAMTEDKLNKRFIVQATTRVCHDKEFLTALREAGCRVIFIGIETDDPEGLGLVGKNSNVRFPFDPTDIHAAGMAVLGSFIWGLDTDTPQKLRDRAKYMVDCGADSIQLTVVTPLPGTRLYHEMRRDGRLLYTDYPVDWQRYDMQELVFLPHGFQSQEEFYDLGCELVEHIYGDDMLKSMAKRTLSATGCKEAQSVAYMLSKKYQEIMQSKIDVWRKTRSTALV